MGSGERITGNEEPGDEFRVTLLADVEQIGIVEVRSATGGAGSEGEAVTDRPGRRATLLVDADELTVTEFFPPGVVRFNRRVPRRGGRAFNFHMPSSGFGDHLRGQNPGFDQHDPPADGGGDPASVVLARLSG